jgi:hypothetical protein
MNRKLAHQLLKKSLAYLRETDQATFEWAHSIGPHTFRNLKEKGFLEHYCFVVYASGFKFSVLNEKFSQISGAFKKFDPASLSRMRSLKPVLALFNHERKASCFLEGAKKIHSEGFKAFKNRLREEGTEALQSLPGIGPITKDHLAKNIGLADVAKADIWLERAAKLCGASTVSELTAYLGKHFKLSEHVVDVSIWHFGQSGQFKLLG